jgi:hypothetical protein
MRPMRVVTRASHTDSRPRAGNASSGHFSTSAAGHGARAKTPQCGLALSRSEFESRRSPIPVINVGLCAKVGHLCFFGYGLQIGTERVVSDQSVDRQS